MKKINLKARFKRQSRIVKEKKDFWIKKSRLHTNSIFSIIFIFLVILFPIYPSIASYIKGESKLDFYRWNIDKSSIISSFDGKELEDMDLFSSEDNYISINTPLDDNRDTSWVNKIIEYTAEKWETIASIANKFQVKKSSILDLNKKFNTVAVKAWDKLRILPVNWIYYTIRSGDLLSTIARKYWVSEEKIRQQNFWSGAVSLIAWKKLIIPWGKLYIKPIKIEKKKIINKNLSYKKPVRTKKKYKKTYRKPTVKTKKTYKKYKQIISKSWYYKLRKRKAYSGVPGNCTRYVASYKSVNWRWNANRWLYNAAKKWRKVYYWRITPNPWFIVVFNGRGYNPRYGHVAIVMSVNRKNRTMVVSDMNYAGLRRITYRTVKLNHRAIRWYIDIP